MSVVLFIFPFLILILLVPLIIGISLLRNNLPLGFRHMLGTFTVKPIVATPFWFSMIEIIVAPNWRRPIPDFFVLAIPGIGLTLLILWIYRATVKKHVGLVLLVLLLDSMRWGSSSIGVVMYQTGQQEGTIMMFAGVVMPTIFAIAILMIISSQVEMD